MPSKKKKLHLYQELVDVHRRVDRDLPAKVVFKLVLAAAGRGRVAEELGEALMIGRERESFLTSSMVVSFFCSLSLSTSYKHAFEPFVTRVERHEAHLDAHGGREPGGLERVGKKKNEKQGRERLLRFFYRFLSLSEKVKASSC